MATVLSALELIPPRLPFATAPDEVVQASHSSGMIGHPLHGKLHRGQFFVYQRGAVQRLVVRDAVSRLQWKIKRR